MKLILPLYPTIQESEFAQFLTSSVKFDGVEYSQNSPYNYPIKCDREIGRIFHQSGVGIVGTTWVAHTDINKYSSYSTSLSPGVPGVYYGEDGLYRPFKNDPVFSLERIKQRIARRIVVIKQIYNGTIALENTNYYPTGAYEYICEPEFIKEVIEENDINFCFDYAHAKISAFHMNITFIDYINRLPMDRISEIHLSEPFVDNSKSKGIMKDAHGKPSTATMLQFRLLAEKFGWYDKDIYVVVEHWKNIFNLYETYKRLDRFRRAGMR